MKPPAVYLVSADLSALIGATVWMGRVPAPQPPSPARPKPRLACLSCGAASWVARPSGWVCAYCGWTSPEVRR